MWTLESVYFVPQNDICSAKQNFVTTSKNCFLTVHFPQHVYVNETFIVGVDVYDEDANSDEEAKQVKTTQLTGNKV